MVVINFRQMVKLSINSKSESVPKYLKLKEKSIIIRQSGLERKNTKCVNINRFLQKCLSFFSPHLFPVF